MTTPLVPIATLANRVHPGPGWATPPSDAPRRLPRAQRPSLDDFQTTHPDVPAIVAGVRRWGAAYRHALAAQARPDATAADCRPPSLILSGPNGTGKTAIANVIRWRVLTVVALDSDGNKLPDSVSPGGRWFAAADLLSKLGHESDSDGYRHTARPGQLAGGSPFVIIDDVGAELTIPYVAQEAQEIERHHRYHLFLDWCYGNNVPVVLTTNLTAFGDDSALARHLGPRAWSRLMQMCPAGYVFSLWNVPDYRKLAGGRGPSAS